MVCFVWLWIKFKKKTVEKFYDKKIFFKLNAKENQLNSEIDIWLLILNIYHDTEYFEICAFSWINKNNLGKKLWIIFKEIKKILHKKKYFLVSSFKKTFYRYKVHCCTTKKKWAASFWIYDSAYSDKYDMQKNMSYYLRIIVLLDNLNPLRTTLFSLRFFWNKLHATFFNTIHSIWEILIFLLFVCRGVQGVPKI